MKNTLNILERISLGVGKSVSYILLLLMLTTVTVVVIRYLFQSGSIALQELTVYLHASIFTLAAGYGLQTNSHVRVDIFFQKMSEVQQAWVNIFGTLFLLFPFCVFSFWISWPYVIRSWEIGERSADAGGLPAVFLLKTLILLFVVVLLFQAVIELLRNILLVLHKAEHLNRASNQGKV